MSEIDAALVVVVVVVAVVVVVVVAAVGAVAVGVNVVCETPDQDVVLGAVHIETDVAPA